MSEKDTTTTTVTADVETTEPTPVPPGMVRMADVMAVVRDHAENDGWCSTAEDYTARAFRSAGVDLDFQYTGETPCTCPMCTRDRVAQGGEENPVIPPRFTPTKETAEFISQGQLHGAIKAARRLSNSSDLYAELREKFLSGYVVPGLRSFTVSFTVSESDDYDLFTGGGVPTALNMLRAYVRDYGQVKDFTATEITAPAATPADTTNL